MDSANAPNRSQVFIPGQVNHVWQTVFQGSNPKDGIVFHPRRAHKKSRAGCFTCKKRRVKCDEQKPFCQRCEKYGVSCSYPPVSVSTNSRCTYNLEDALVHRGPSKAAFTLSLTDMATKIHEALGPDARYISEGLREQNASHPLSVLALQHFIRCSAETNPNLAIRKVMQNDMVHVAFTTPHLMYTLIGVGILHLNRCSQGSHTRRVAEAHFWEQAIRLYQNALKPKLSQENIDAIISTCLFIGITALCPEKFEPSDSWVLSNNPEAMNWLQLQSGIRHILVAAIPYMAKSIWATAFASSAQEEAGLFDCSGKMGRANIDPDLADLCGIHESTTQQTNPYYAPARFLAGMLELERNPSNAARCNSFMGVLDREFLALLQQRDPAALVILANWMGLMCLVSQWQHWVEGRIRTECTAICMYLESSTEPKVLKLLDFPAQSCGYILNSAPPISILDCSHECVET
ncbi:hypothetical protein FE257_003459 [Aspergillus nanangensis]|uniref:Zn(2)-C6 fungal-type domain-containing protein n=1 Tax=Aspergillus nanangensis TaxID=2582783 RepID=A0AAD4CBM2_ASPNN|nr:hypothetical protein FE257_003459 [Aspergillus nanangensis]